MQDIVNLCSSALMASTTALRNTSNNLANMNTAGFKGSTVSFSNLFDAGNATSGGPANGGVYATAPELNMRAGSYVTTGNATDLAVLGAGVFALKDADGKMVYTRNGQFSWEDGKLQARDGSTVQALGPNGLEDIVIPGEAMSMAGVATKSIGFESGAMIKADDSKVTTDDVVKMPVKVRDSLGGTHDLELEFKVSSYKPPTENWWDVQVLQGNASIGSPATPFTVKFQGNSEVLPGSDKMAFEYTTPTGEKLSVEVSFEKLKVGTSNTFKTPVVDGKEPGTLQMANLSFDDNGFVEYTYTNGEKIKGQQVALCMAENPDDWKQVGSSRFEPKAGSKLKLGVAGDDFGTISARQLEGSNVDMSAEFSNLILAQRVYQSASQVMQAAGSLADTLLASTKSR